MRNIVTRYMNRKTFEIVALLEVTAEGRYIIEMEDGSQKSYAATSFKKMFKAVEVDLAQITLDEVTEETESVEAESVETAAESDEAVEVTVDPLPVENPDYVDEPIPQKNDWEKIADEQLTNAYNWIVGELESSVQDGVMTEEEFRKELNGISRRIYREAVTTKYGEDFCGGKAPSEMRFATKNYCMGTIVKLLKRDGYYVEKVEMRDFTNRAIGIFEAVFKNGLYEVITKTGKVFHFDREGLQIDAKIPKFGNRIIFGV